MIVVSLVFILVYAAVNIAVAWPLVVRLDHAGRLTGAERAAVAFGVGTIGLYLAVFAVGHYRLDATSMAGVSAAWTLLALPGLRAIAWASVWRAATSALRGDRIEILLWVAIAGVAGSSLLQGLAPPNDYDSLMYHLAIPRLDVERGWIAPVWDRALPHAFFPALAGHQYRLVLALIGEGPVQMIQGLYGVMAAAGTVALVGRLGFGRRTALLAALLFLTTRVVIWEMATAEVEVILTAYAVIGLVVYLAWREEPRLGLMSLVGTLMAGMVLSKLTGGAMAIAIALPMLVDLVRRPLCLPQVAAGACVGLAVLLPHLAYMAALTGNPLFPMFNEVLAPHLPTFFEKLREAYGIGRGPVELVIAPWFIATQPMQHFDGMILGAPVFLALTPLAVLARPIRHGGTVLTVIILYYVFWFYLLSQQVRFLMPVFPALAAFSAIGVAALWRRTAGSMPARVIAAALLLLMAGNQALFVGIYAVLRLPVAVGLKSAEHYFTHTPTMDGAFYTPCVWLHQVLRPGERILSLLTPHSYFCPQLAAVVRYFPDEEKAWLSKEPERPIPTEEFIRRFREGDFRYVIVPTVHEHRRSTDGSPVRETVKLSAHRLGAIAPFLDGLAPLASDHRSAIYDGHEIRRRMDEPLRH